MGDSMVTKIIDHRKLMFVADLSRPQLVAYQKVLTAAVDVGDRFYDSSFAREGRLVRFPD